MMTPSSRFPGSHANARACSHRKARFRRAFAGRAERTSERSLLFMGLAMMALLFGITAFSLLRPRTAFADFVEMAEIAVPAVDDESLSQAARTRELVRMRTQAEFGRIKGSRSAESADFLTLHPPALFEFDRGGSMMNFEQGFQRVNWRVGPLQAPKTLSPVSAPHRAPDTE